MTTSSLRPGASSYATTVHPALGNFEGLGLLQGALQTAADKRLGGKAVEQAAPGARYTWTLLKPDGAALDLLAAGQARGRCKLPLGWVVPLADAAQAFTHVQQGRPGRAELLCGARSG